MTDRKCWAFLVSTFLLTPSLGLADDHDSCEEALSVARTDTVAGAPELAAVWLTFVGSGNPVVVSATDANGDFHISTVLDVYRGDCEALEAMPEVHSDYSPLAVVDTEPGEQYFIHTASTAANVNLEEYRQPSNDDCAGALRVDLRATNPSTFSGDNIAAELDADGKRGVWYLVRGTGGAMEASTCDQALLNARIEVFTGTCSALQPVNAGQSICGINTTTASWQSDVSTDYFVHVYSAEPFCIHCSEIPRGTFDLTVSGEWPDCNENRVDDYLEIASGEAEDCDGNGWIDACEVTPVFAIGDNDVYEVRSDRRGQELTTIDFDGDGLRDVAVISDDATRDLPSSTRVSLFRNDGSGELEFAYDVILDELLPGSNILRPRAVAADFDGDGSEDLAVSGGQYPVFAILLNNSGRLEVASILDTEDGNRRELRVLEPGDIDGDGDIDLATISGTRRAVGLLWNNGRGEFLEQSEVDVPTNFLSDIELADLDGDRDLDLLAITSSPYDLTVFRNTSGTLELWSEYALPEVDDFHWFLDTGDLNGDDAVDVVAMTREGMTVLYNLGNGDLGTAQHYEHLGASSLSEPLFLDADDDGDIDVASAGWRDRVWLFPNSGDSFERRESIRAETEVLEARTVDFDNDLDLDFAVVNTREVYFLENRGSGEFVRSALTPIHQPNNRTGALVIGDVHGDGLVDFVTTSEQVPDLRIVASNERAQLFEGPRLDLREPAVAAAVGNINGDRYDDIVVVNLSQNSLSVFLSGELAVFAEPVDYPAGTSPVDVQLGLLNDDAHLDVVVVNSGSHDVTIYHNDGSGGLVLDGAYPVIPDPTAVAVLDTNDDNVNDLVVAGGGEDLGVYTGGAEGGYLESATVPVGAGTQVVPFNANGDSLLDFVVAHLAGLSVVVNRGTEGFEIWHAPLTTMNGRQAGIAVGDLNLDGLEDVAYVNGQIVFLLFGTGIAGPGALQWPLVAPIQVPLRPTLRGNPLAFAIQLADVDRDGDRDLALLVEHEEIRVYERLVVLYNDAVHPTFSDLDLNGVVDACERSFYRGDANASGAADISDAIRLNMYLFAGGEAPPCLESADTNNDGGLDISDSIYLLNFLFAGGPSVPEPGTPASGACGPDPEGGNLGCASYPPCQ